MSWREATGVPGAARAFRRRPCRHYGRQHRAQPAYEFRAEVRRGLEAAIVSLHPAVAVYVQGPKVGYLPRDKAPVYQPMLRQLEAQGQAVIVAARAYAFRDLDGNAHVSVSREMGLPHLMLPINAEPAESALLPEGAAAQVTKEDQHMEALAPFFTPEGECWAYATLHSAAVQTAKTRKPVVEVRLDGNKIGELSGAGTTNFLEAVRALESVGRTTTARAYIKGNRLKCECTLYAQKAHELSSEWLDRYLTPPPPRPATPRFNPPPGWPPAPEGWLPPAGWRPPPGMPPAPANWQWIVVERS